MTQLTRKGVKFDWTKKCKGSFQELKKRLTSALVLTLLERSEGIVVYIDASKKGLGCVLIQHDKVICLYLQTTENT
jgi:hypothetical protein